MDVSCWPTSEHVPRAWASEIMIVFIVFFLLSRALAAEQNDRSPLSCCCSRHFQQTQFHALAALRKIHFCVKEKKVGNIHTNKVKIWNRRMTAETVFCCFFSCSKVLLYFSSRPLIAGALWLFRFAERVCVSVSTSVSTQTWKDRRTLTLPPAGRWRP